MKKTIILILMVMFVGLVMFTGCKGTTDVPEIEVPEKPEEELAQELADQGFAAYEYDTGEIVLYSTNEANERLFFKDNKVTYFNDYEGAEVVMTFGENGWPSRISGNFGTIVIENVADDKFDFVIFDIEGNIEIHRDVPIDETAFAMMQNLMAEDSDSRNAARIAFSDISTTLAIGTFAIDSFLCGASVAATFTPVAPVAGMAAIKYCGGAFISLTGLIIDDPAVSGALFLAHTALNPEMGIVSGIYTTSSAIAIAGTLWEEEREDEIQLYEGALISGGGEGDIKVTLTWDTTADIDLHMLTPNDGHIWYGNPSEDGGTLDFDDINGYGPENIFWEDGTAPSGDYTVYIHHFSRISPTSYGVMIQIGNETYSYSGVIEDDERIDILSFTL